MCNYYNLIYYIKELNLWRKVSIINQILAILNTKLTHFIPVLYLIKFTKKKVIYFKLLDT